MDTYRIGGPDAAIVELSAQHLSAESAEDADEDTGEKILYLYLGDDENAVEIRHEFGSPEVAAAKLMVAAEAMRAHAERLRYRARMRSAGWT